MKKLVESIVKDLLPEEDKPKIKKVVGIYGGRYQPFGPHHYKTYKWLKSKVDDALHNHIKHQETTKTSNELQGKSSSHG